MATAPAWQTEELEEEWIEEDVQDGDDENDDHAHSISLTEPLPSAILTNDSPLSATSKPAGTVLVHHGAPSAPLFAKTPAKNKRGKGIKDFFSPLPLEKMFEPPSPVQKPEAAETETVPEPQKTVDADAGAKASLAYTFTFTAPRASFLNLNSSNKSLPQAESTPVPPSSTTPDPPLRLFQFQYDTYTRDHLSAMIDSIAVNTPSGTTTSSHHPQRVLSRVTELPSSSDSFSHLRSAKRVKLSPDSDYCDGGQVSITRPRIFGKDYVDASRSLMRQIREAREFSTVSTVVSAPNMVAGHLPDTSEKDNSEPKAKPGYSSSRFRQQAADLMAQIKNDMKVGQKRIFSADTDFSDYTHREDAPEKENRSFSRTPSSQKSYRDISLGKPPLRPVNKLVSSVSKLTIDDHQFNVEPIVVGAVQLEPSNPGFLSIPQFFPSASVRSGRNEDLNRYVSSSTASGTTTLTAGSAGSYVKHSGPAQLKTIAPGDLPSIPQKLGNMFFDKALMKWVKQTAQAAAGRDEMGEQITAEDPSEDPFEDIESLRDESQLAEAVQPTELSRVEEESEVEDAEEMELTSFETDNPTARIVDVMTGVETDASDSDSDLPNDSVGDIPPEELEFAYEKEPLSSPELPSISVPPSSLSVPVASTAASTPLRKGANTPGATPMKSALKSHSTTPQDQRYRTPMRRGHRRSVSFSDGKRDGPIRGLGRDDAQYSESAVVSFVPSARSKRIAHMMEALEDSDSDFEDDSPSKTNSSAGRPDEIQPLSERQVTPAGARRPFSRSLTHRPSPGNSTRASIANTFLTECSFGVAHDRLVQVITDVEPFEPYWEQLTCIDLSGRNIDSAARLKEFLPRLDTLNMNSNQLSWLSGVPSSVRTLSVSSNSLTSVTSYHHLPNLVSLDISKNEIDSISQLKCLRHLRELRADSNKITSLDGLESMDALVKLSLQGNSIRTLDLERYRWTRLEMLDLSHNCLGNISGVASLASMIALNIDHNKIQRLEIVNPMPRLRILRASGNRLTKLNVGPMVNLRTLYLDNNSLVAVMNLERLTKMENLSMRNQQGRGLNLVTGDVRDVKRLYLSGNPLGDGFLSEACYNLVYVELAACRLTSLPEDLAMLIPNVRVLNLNYNFLEDVRALEGLNRLRKLTIIGSRLKGTKMLIRLSQRLPDVEMLDFRMNPCTLGWYLPLLVKDAPEALQPSETVDSWLEMDSKFRRDLPDEVYVGRLAYRGLVMESCRRLKMLDGIEVCEKERVKASRVVVGILGKRPS